MSANVPCHFHSGGCYVVYAVCTNAKSVLVICATLLVHCPVWYHMSVVVHVSVVHVSCVTSHVKCVSAWYVFMCTSSRCMCACVVPRAMRGV